MNLKDYFAKSRGVGVLSTADAQGREDDSEQQVTAM
jgi:hypothetical protein